MRHGLDECLLTIDALKPIRFLRFFTPFYWLNRHQNVSRGERIRRFLEDLGPLYVKFGQILSTRRDLLPDDMALELAKLQDQVPPFSGELARHIIETELGQSTTVLFAEFDVEPLASASIAQVHPARLHNGDQVIIKVVRPGIEKTIRRDIALLYALARLVQHYSADLRRLRPVEIVREYEKTIHDELDLMREASNCALLRRNFTQSELLYVPEIYWDHTSNRVMTQERIFGAPVNQVETHRRNGIDIKMLAERGVEIFFTQVFRDNFFHADMHPGNIFVGDDGRYIGVDFGIMGALTTQDQRYLAENLLAFFHRDYRRVAELHVESGWTPPDTPVEEFEAAIRSVSEPIWERPISEISFGHFLLRLFQTARRFNMEVQPQLVLLQKTLLNIEGLGRQLYPELDLWQTAKPFMEKWMAEQVGPRAFVRRVKASMPQLSEELPELPHLTYRVLKKAVDGELEIRWRSDQLTALQQQIARDNRRQRWVISGGVLLIGAGLLNLSDHTLLMVMENRQLASIIGGVGVLLLLYGLIRK